jgi:hypothetical protein
MAARTIDPSRINDLGAWLKNYNARYANLKHNPRDGSFLVLSPQTMDINAPVKVLRPAQGIDAASYIVNGADSELRAQSETRMASIGAERTAAASEFTYKIREVEQELLKLCRSRNETTDDSAKTDIALEVGKLQAQLADLERKKQGVLFPHKIVKTMENLPRMIFDYNTRDERTTKFAVELGVPLRTTGADRQVLIEAGNS